MATDTEPAEQAPAEVSTRRERVGWYFYDWANSAFSTTVITVFLGPYLTSIAKTAAGCASDDPCRDQSIPVLWFSIVPLGPRNTVVLPAVTELRDDGTVRLDNGWIVPHAEVIKRLGCDDTTSLTDFITRYGEGSSTSFSLDEQKVISVTCAVPNA